MSLERIRNAVEMTAHPKLSQLLALLIDHSGLTISTAATVLDLPNLVVLRLANSLVRLGCATRVQGSYFVTFSGREIDAVMRNSGLR